jgi:hypothetical protein
LPSKTFVKVKFDSNNEFEKIKARLVDGGDRQNRYLYSKSEASLPTISLVGLYIIAVIAANEERHVITADVAGAYLRAFMKKLVLIQINQTESAMLVEMLPALLQHHQLKICSRLMRHLLVCASLMLRNFIQKLRVLIT